MNATINKATIQGVEMTFTRGFDSGISWTSDWTKTFDLYQAGFLTTKSRRGTYGHSTYYLSAKGRKTAGV